MFMLWAGLDSAAHSKQLSQHCASCRHFAKMSFCRQTYNLLAGTDDDEHTRRMK